MATIVKQGSAAQALGIEAIVTVDEMPSNHRGKAIKDLSEFETFLTDNAAHAIEGVKDRNEREKFARVLRAAAAQIGCEVSTAYVEDEKRMYFRGYPEGTAPARGRRSVASRAEAVPATKK